MTRPCKFGCRTRRDTRFRQIYGQFLNEGLALKMPCHLAVTRQIAIFRLS
jgi:hypothetical protein